MLIILMDTVDGQVRAINTRTKQQWFILFGVLFAQVVLSCLSLLSGSTLGRLPVPVDQWDTGDQVTSLAASLGHLLNVSVLQGGQSVRVG
jgi:hypothetical protein